MHLHPTVDRLHHVQARANLRQRQPGGVDADVDRQCHRVGKAGQQHRRGDSGRVRDGVGVGGVPVAHRITRQCGAGNVARCHHERETERRLTVLVGQRGHHTDCDTDPFAGQDVAHAHGEDVGALLLGDGGASA